MKSKPTRNASLVQLVERRSPKPDVEGSSPSGRVAFTLINNLKIISKLKLGSKLNIIFFRQRKYS
jgi:hypothetical protein